MSIDVTIAVTGINAKPDNPGPGLAVARCLRETPEFSGRIIGLGYDALDPGMYLKEFCDAAYILPYPSVGDEALIATLKNIQEKENIEVFIPCLDAELPSFIRLEPILKDLGLKTFLPSQEQFRLRNKDRLTELAQHAGIDTPDTKSLTSPSFFRNCEDQGWTFPLVVKGLFYDAEIVFNEAEARSAFRRIAAEWGFPVLLQKLVQGEEYNLMAVGDGHGNLLGPVMIKKMAVTDKGKAWAGVSIDDKTLLNASASLVKAIKWRGPLEVEVIRDRNSRYQLIEINPRFPAWTYISAGMGRNLPLALLQLSLGLPVSDFKNIETGIMFVRYAMEVISSIHDFESVIMKGGRTLKS